MAPAGAVHVSGTGNFSDQAHVFRKPSPERPRRPDQIKPERQQKGTQKNGANQIVSKRVHCATHVEKVFTSESTLSGNVDITALESFLSDLRIREVPHYAKNNYRFQVFPHAFNWSEKK